MKLNNCVSESLFLKKYRDLVFWDPDTDKTFKVWGENGEFHTANAKMNIERGWTLVCTNEDGKDVGWCINDELCGLIADTPQADGIEVIRRDPEA